MSELVLGIDAGGTRTRWALMAADGAIAAEGEVRGLSALQVRETSAASSCRCSPSSRTTPLPMRSRRACTRASRASARRARSAS